MITNDVQKLEPGSIIRLFELDATSIGGNIERFHGQMKEGVIWWQGEQYNPINIDIDGLEVRGDGRQPTPTLTVANKLNGITGLISALCLRLDDLVGSKLIIHETFKHYLDAINFPSGENPTASNEEKRTIWYVEQKTNENIQQVEFRLSNPADFQGQRIPARQITSLCHWACTGGYRGGDCNYKGIKMFDELDNQVDDPALDRCGGRLKSCRARGNEDSFGGFPASDLIIQ